jgi:hypothetical protein
MWAPKIYISIPWSVFFNDCTALSPKGLEADTTFYAEALFKLLGINFASEGSKAPPFSEKFKTLGLIVDAGEAKEKTVRLGHTPERSSELLGTLEEILSHEHVSTKTLEQLHGRIVWFRTFIFGRKLNAATRVLSWFSRKSSPRISLEPKLRVALMDLKNHLLKSTTVSINRDLNETWIIFTDGAFEPSNDQPASIGGILINPSGKVISYFGSYMSGTLLNDFLAEARHPIYELEIFLVVVAIRAVSKFIVGKLVIHYLDNDAARSAFIRASASTSLGTALVADYVNFEYRCHFSPWFARVASHSNPADQPSRLDFSPIWLRDAERFELVLPVHLSQWGIIGCTDFEKA